VDSRVGSGAARMRLWHDSAQRKTVEVSMKADEAADLMDKDRESDRFKQRAAIAIAIFAMLLAITGLGGNNATKDTINGNIQASNFYAFFQAKNMRQTAYRLAADEFELGWLNEPALPAEVKARMQERLKSYRETVARYESEPKTGEGMKELLERAKAQEQVRDRALRQDPYFDYSEALLQIAIVLISVSIVANIVWLAFLGGAVGIAGGLLCINGFLLLVDVPGLS
jgi:hypothetical protein